MFQVRYRTSVTARPTYPCGGTASLYVLRPWFSRRPSLSPEPWALQRPQFVAAVHILASFSFSHTGTVRFIAFAGAGTGRLPLWLEGRAAS